MARLLSQRPALKAELRARLARAADAAAQNAALASILEVGAAAAAAQAAPGGPATGAGAGAAARRKFEFHRAGMKVTARSGEIVIRCDEDFVGMSRERLEEAISAFRDSLLS